MRDVIIIGSQGAIGGYLAEALSETCHVYGTYHENLKEFVGVENLAVVDVTVPSMCHTYSRVVGPRLGKEIVLINAFGISVDGIGHKIDAEHWQNVIKTNLTGVFNICQAILPIMRLNRWGRIINLSSVVGHVGVPGTAAYAASKAGLEGLTRTLAVENAAMGITVNALALGYMNLGLIDTIDEQLRSGILLSVPVGHFGHPDNIVNAVKFLIESDYVTGTTVVVDGGFLCK